MPSTQYFKSRFSFDQHGAIRLLGLETTDFSANKQFRFNQRPLFRLNISWKN